MNDFHKFRQNAENCQRLAEAAKDEAEAKRYGRMAEAWLALANEQDWLDGEAPTEWPTTGKDPLMGFRAPPVMRASIVKWAEKQADKPTLSEAIPRLVAVGLTAKVRPKGDTESKHARAKELAHSAIDKMSDVSASADDKVARKRRLMKGPEEFREARMDRSERK
ncbi:MAG: hypothetical protein V4602_05275 [Pseudomonadota bacterium]